MPKFAKHGSFNIALLSLFGGLVLVVLRQRFHVVQQLTNGGVESSLRNTTFPTSAHDGIVPMVYDKKTLPCYPSSKNWLDSNIRSQQTRTGIFFVESSKTDSTTGTSITLKMASSLSKDYKMCKVRFSHASASKMQYHERDEERSFLWSLVREPTSRAMLEFAHYQVSWRNVPPTLENMKQYFHHVKRHNKQLKTLALTSSKHVIGHEREAIHTILNEYDFLGVTERMDESAVALQMLLGLKISHVMYIPSDDSKEEYDSGSHKGQCWLIPELNISQGVQDYFKSDEWNRVIYWDSVLHKAANLSLDLTIEALGRDEFQQNLKEFQRIRKELMEKCKIVVPCSEAGVAPIPQDETDCIIRDSACGFYCMDEYFRKYYD